MPCESVHTDDDIPTVPFDVARFPQGVLVFQCFLWLHRYYKVNEVQKFTFSKKKDESQNDVTVSSFAKKLDTCGLF